MFSAKVLCLLGCVFAAVVVMPSNAGVAGGITPLSGEKLKEAEGYLQESLTKLAAGEGPSYKIQKVNSATHQVVSGSLYNFNVDLVNDKEEVKKCDVRIWSQPWLENGIEVTFKCPGEEKVVKKHSV